MQPISWRRILLVIQLGTVILLSQACGGRSTPPPEPELTGFGVSPTQMCISFGVPIVQVDWTVEGSSGVQSCMDITINGTSLGGAIEFNDWQEALCGEGDYSKQVRFSLTEIFGNNTPSTATIVGELWRDFRQGEYTQNRSRVSLGTSQATMTTITCTPGFTPTP